jgi:dTDP-D-glucose 4,6-dehydratase
LGDIKRDSRYRFVRGDISNINHVTKLVKGQDAVINCAADRHNPK